MAARPLRYIRGFIVVLSFCSAAFVQSAPFPKIDDIDFAFFTTEVQITDVVQDASAYATHYHDLIQNQGAIKLYFQGELRSVYYDNSSYQITEVNGGNCSVWDEDTSDYYYTPLYFGWLNRDPLVIGPSALLWYAQTRRSEIVTKGSETVRSILCDKYQLSVKNKLDELQIEYYFAPANWTTPYQYKNLRVPIRIRVTGMSSRYSADKTLSEKVDQINDFAFFRPTIEDYNNLLPPIGLGCRFKQETDMMPEIPIEFQYSAEVVDLLSAEEQEYTEIQFQKTWYDHRSLLARRDKSSKKEGFVSNLYDFNTGTMYSIQDGGSCQMKTLRDTEFQIYDYGLTSRLMTPEEVLNLDGSFYEMGKREIRGMRCDVYESVAFDQYYMDKQYYKLVVTVYFTESATNVGVTGEVESRIPVYFIITGWSTPKEKTLQLQYNIFEFDDVVWPAMYSTFRVDRCFTTENSKAYFVLILEVSAEAAAIMEDQDEIIMGTLRRTIAKHAKVPELRIPYLKATYKPTGVFVTGVMLERPPSLLQFYKMDSDPNTKTFDPDLKIIAEAVNLEQCSYACIDEGDFPCKGFYFCGEACFLKSTDPFDQEDTGNEKLLGECTEYIRAEQESSNFGQSYLKVALERLEKAVFNKSIAVEFELQDAEATVKVKDIIIGDGPYTGVDAGDKPFVLSVELRKLDRRDETTNVVNYAGTLHECYKRCKAVGAYCSSFSFCPDAPDDKKECMVSSVLILKGITKDTELVVDKNCNIYNLKFLDYFTAYPETVSLLLGDKVINKVDSLELCAQSCRKENSFLCRGFEYCKSQKVCTLHKKHILDFKPGEKISSETQCIHYAAKYIADFRDLGHVPIGDTSNVIYDLSLEDCAKVCTEDLNVDCKSFDFCSNEDLTKGKCALSKKVLDDDGVEPVEDPTQRCIHYEKRDTVHDWDKNIDKTTAPPTINPSDKPVTTPSDKPVTTPSDKPVITPSDKPITTPSDKPVTTPSDKPVITPSDKPVTTSSDKPITTPSDKPVTTPSDKPVITPSDKPIITPSDKPVITPSDKPVVTPSDQQTTNPSDKPTINPSDNPTINPSDNPSGDPTGPPKPTKLAKITKVSEEGYTKKGFTGLVVGMIFFGIVVGALGYVLYSYIKSRRSSVEGIPMRFINRPS